MAKIDGCIKPACGPKCKNCLDKAIEGLEYGIKPDVIVFLDAVAERKRKELLDEHKKPEGA